MSIAGEKLTLQAFLSRAEPLIHDDLQNSLAELHRIIDHLAAPLDGEPELAAQLSKLRTTAPASLGQADPAQRHARVPEALKLVEDIKQRWIAAEDPPLVDEVDEHIEAMTNALDRVRDPGADALRMAADRIDRLARTGDALEGIERRFAPWAIAALVLFVIGIVLFLAPGLLNRVPVLASFWTILFCLGALPGVAILYARRVLPRSRADHEIDALNRRHFLPLGGLYFPEGAHPAGVVLVGPMPEKTEGEQAREERQKHRDAARPKW